MKRFFLSTAILGLGVYAFGSSSYADVGLGQAFSVLVPSSSAFQTVSDSPLAEGAETFIEGMASHAITFLGDPSMSESKKQAEFRKLLQKNFDMRTIGRFALGRYWNVASEPERAEYQKLFEEMIIEVYSRRFSEYQGQALEVRSSRQDSDKDVTVNSYIVPDSGSEVRVDWRVRKKNGTYKIVDVMVEGVSMGVTQRSDFASVIQRGGGQVSVLLAHLRNE